MRRIFLLSISLLMLGGCSRQDEYRPAPGALKQAQNIAAYEEGLSLTRRKKYENAIVKFGEVIKRDPDFLEAYLARGNAETEIRSHSQAINDFNKALQIDSSIKQSREYIYVFRDMSVCHVALKQWKDAIADADIMTALDKGYPWAYMTRSIAYAALGKGAESDREGAQYEKLLAEFNKNN